jgi:hypothetical protein
MVTFSAFSVCRNGKIRGMLELPFDECVSVHSSPFSLGDCAEQNDVWFFG